MDRLETIVDMIEFETCIADVGCDHGYVGLELFKKNKIEKLIATDISEECLEKSNRLFKNLPYNYEGRVGDGLNPIENAEADAVIIAGMGGDLISKIVTDDISKTKSIKKFIIQPMTEPEKVRETFYKIGFKRTRDLIVKEKKHFYFIIEFTNEGGDEVDDFMYTKLLRAHPLFESYITHEINKRMAIVEQIKKNSSAENASLKKLQTEIEELKALVN